MADARIYQLGSSLSLDEVAQALERFLIRQKGLEAEGVSQSESVYFIQARQRESWKKFAGLDKAVQIRLTVHQGNLTVDVGAGRWVDKLGAATVGYLLFAPLLITAAIGALDQEQLPREIFDCVEQYIILHGGPIPGMTDRADPIYEDPGQSTEGVSCCSRCGAPLSAGARFCSQCGQAVPMPGVCPGCHEPVAEGARFCSACGTPLGKDL